MKAAGILLIAPIVFGLNLSGISQVPEKATGAVATARSANWEVTIVTAAMYTQPRVNPYAPGQYLEPPVYKKDGFNLALELRFTYLGPPGEIPAPRISAVNEKGEEFHAMGNISTTSEGDLDALGWLVSLARNEPDKRALKAGEKFGAKQPVTFYIGDIPLTSSEIKIVFADIPPIPVKPTQLKPADQPGEL